RWGLVEPSPQVRFHVLTAPGPGEFRLLVALHRAEVRGDDVEIRRPFAVRLDPGLESQPLLVDAGRGRRRDVRRALEGLSFVPEYAPALGHARRVRSLLLQ